MNDCPLATRATKDPRACRVIRAFLDRSKPAAKIAQVAQDTTAESPPLDAPALDVSHDFDSPDF